MNSVVSMDSNGYDEIQLPAFPQQDRKISEKNDVI
jgi:hypothetical protein